MHGTVSPSRVASPSRVRLDASVSRPVTAISPMVMKSTIAWSSTTRSGVGLTDSSLPGRAATDAAESGERAGVSPVAANSGADSAEGTAVIPVQPGPDVTFRVQRFVAPRARRPAGRHDPLGLFGDVPRLGQRQAVAQPIGVALPGFQQDLLAHPLL